MIVLWVLAAIFMVWLGIFTAAVAIVYGAILVDRFGAASGMSNCFFFALRKFLVARKAVDRYRVALVVQWSPRYWGPHVWFARRVSGLHAEEYVPKLRRLVPSSIIFRGRARRSDLKE